MAATSVFRVNREVLRISASEWLVWLEGWSLMRIVRVGFWFLGVGEGKMTAVWLNR